MFASARKIKRPRRRWRTLRDRTERNRDYFYLVTDGSYYGDIRQTAFGIPETKFTDRYESNPRRENAGSRQTLLVRKVPMRPQEKKFPSRAALFFNPASRIIAMTDTQLYSPAISMKSSFARGVWNL